MDSSSTFSVNHRPKPSPPRYRAPVALKAISTSQSVYGTRSAPHAIGSKHENRAQHGETTFIARG
eukprot:3938590-Rhodomonas_salina.4